MSRLTLSLVCVLTLLTRSNFAAEGTSKDEVMKAAKALSEKESYSWSTTVTVPPEAQFRPGPTEGKTEKNGATYLKMIFNDITTEAFMKGTKMALKSGGGDWQSAAELENSEDRSRFMVMRLRNFKSPAEQAEEVLKDIKDLKKEGDVYSGELTEEGAKNLMRFRRGGDGPQISGAKGSAKFTVKDGVLSTMEYKVKGSMNFNGNDVDMDRTTTMQIKDVGSTKLSIPDGAQKKLS